MIKLKLMLGALAAGMAGIFAAYFKGRSNAIREQEIERLRKTTEAYETKDDLRDIHDDMRTADLAASITKRKSDD